MKSHHDAHSQCEHANLKYCAKCKVPYCADCHYEWGNKISNWPRYIQQYQYYPQPYWYSANGYSQVVTTNNGNSAQTALPVTTCSHG